MNNEIKKQLKTILENGNEGALLIMNLRENTDSPFSQRLLKQGYNYQLLAMDIDCIEYYLESGDIDGEEYGEEQGISEAEKMANSYLDNLNGYVIVK